MTIAGRKTEGTIFGKVLFNGCVADANLLKKYTAYVPQTESFFGGASVYETLLFSVMIRRRESTAYKLQLIEHVIDQMNLDKCRHALVGNHVIRGISGGEMKRLALAVALLAADARAMFIDEPTSGLDSSMASDVMNALQRLQHEDGRTIILTIHQPSIDIYKAFDKLMLLSGGHLVFFGGANNSLEFFSTQGFAYEAGVNIAEYLIDCISSESTVEYYANSQLCEENKKEVKELSAIVHAVDAECKTGPYAYSFFAELIVMLRYKDLRRWRRGIFWFTRLGLYSTLGALFSSFFFNQTYTPSGIINRNGVLFISVILPAFMAQVHVEEVKFEREVYTRELHDSLYRPLTYVTSKILAEVPMTILASVTYSAILYFSIGLQNTAAAFAFFCLGMFTNFTIAQLIGSTIAASIPGDVGPAAILPIFSTLYMLVGGFFIRASTLHVVWKWLYTISYIQWSWSCLMVNEYDKREFYDHCDSEGTNELLDQLALPDSSRRILNLLLGTQACTAITGESILRPFELTSRNKFISLGYAACSIPVFFTFFYLGVSRVRHEKR